MLTAPFGSEKTNPNVWLVPTPELGVTETTEGGTGGEGKPQKIRWLENVARYTFPFATRGETNLAKLPSASRPGFCPLFQSSRDTFAASKARTVPALASWNSEPATSGVTAQTMPVPAVLPLEEPARSPPGKLVTSDPEVV